MINNYTYIGKKIIFFVLVALIAFIFTEGGCSSPNCAHCKVKIRVVNVPENCRILESFCSIGIGSKEQLDSVNQGFPVSLRTKVVRQLNPIDPENMGEFDVDCDKGVVVRSMYILLDDCCPSGGGNAFYFFNGLEIYSNIFQDQCEVTLTYNFDYDFTFVRCY